MMFIDTRHRLAATLLALGTVAMADELRVFELQHRPAEELLPVIRPLLGREEAASASGFRLIVRGSDRHLQEIEHVLAKLDVPRQALTLVVRYAYVSDRAGESYGLSGEARIGEQGRVDLPAQADGANGLVVEHRGVRLQTERVTTSARREHVQRLRVMDGQRAYIQVGQSQPHVRHILVLAGKQALLSQGVALQSATTGFDVLPHVRGEHVVLEITPRLASVDDPSLGLVSLTELATTIRVRRGEWVDIGELAGTGEEVRRAILASGTQRAGERQTILLKVE